MKLIETDGVKKLLAFRLSGHRPQYREIEDFVRTLIKTGTLAVGEALPTTMELSAAWGVYSQSINLALEPLAKEGLLSRRQNRGTIVLDGNKKILRLGIYENFGSIAPNDRDFLNSIQIELARILEEQNAELKIWIDNRQASKSLPKNLIEACHKREIDGLVCTHPRFELIKPMTKLPVPIALLSNYRGCASRVLHRYADLVENSVRRLAERGARRIALISNLQPNPHTSTFKRQDPAKFYDVFTETVAALGLETRPEWVIRPSYSKSIEGLERFGYDAMKTLWNQNVKPDGLFIYPHTSARGSLTAMLELGVKIPEDLKLVAHGNIETPIITPYPVDWINSSSRTIVEALVKQIQNALDGLRAKPIQLPYKPEWIEHQEHEKQKKIK